MKKIITLVLIGFLLAVVLAFGVNATEVTPTCNDLCMGTRGTSGACGASEGEMLGSKYCEGNVQCVCLPKSCKTDQDCRWRVPEGGYAGVHFKCISNKCLLPDCDTACKEYYGYSSGRCGASSGKDVGSAFCGHTFEQCMCDPSPVDEMPTCSDSDGGNDIYRKGTLKVSTPAFGDQVVSEYCVSESGNRLSTGGYVEELVCITGDKDYAYTHKRTKCPEGYMCKDGACQKEEVDKYECTTDDYCKYNIGAHFKCINSRCQYPSCDTACKEFFGYDWGRCDSKTGYAVGSAYCGGAGSQCKCGNNVADTCFDSDKDNAFVAGHVKGHWGCADEGKPIVTERDYCVDPYTVREYICNSGCDNVLAHDVDCKYGCYNGACRDSSEPVTGCYDHGVDSASESDGDRRGTGILEIGRIEVEWSISGDGSGWVYYAPDKNLQIGKTRLSNIKDVDCRNVHFFSQPTANSNAIKVYDDEIICVEQNGYYGLLIPWKQSAAEDYKSSIRYEWFFNTEKGDGTFDGRCSPSDSEPVVFEVAVNDYPDHNPGQNMKEAYVNVYSIVSFERGKYEGVLRDTLKTYPEGHANAKVKEGEIVGFVGFKTFDAASFAKRWVFDYPPYKNFGNKEDTLCQINTNANRNEYLQNSEDYACAISLSTPYRDKPVYEEVEEEVPVECKDSDGGRNYFRSGYVVFTDSNTRKHDTCWDDGRHLQEYVCENGVYEGDHTYLCPNGCEEGRCLPEEVEVVEEVEAEPSYEFAYDIMRCLRANGCGDPGEDVLAEGWEEVLSDAHDENFQCFERCNLDLKCFLVEMDDCFEKVKQGAAEPTEERYKQCEMRAAEVCHMGGSVAEDEPVEEEVPVEEECEGCVQDEKCIPGKTRFVDRGVPKYCDPFSNKFLPQKSDGVSCQNGYECRTNICIDGVCTETKGLFYKFLKWLGIAE